VERYSLDSLNGLPRDEFTRLVGPVFEYTPWIADRTWSRRPFRSVEGLHTALCETMASAGEEEQVSLIRAHPDLVGGAALAGTLTPQSTHEQASAGLDTLSPEEIGLFQKLNREYMEGFGFPFVICARLNKKEAILAGFRRRLTNSREVEIQTALEEIGKIVWLRLKDLVET
jgi:OHCU decarboxylase